MQRNIKKRLGVWALIVAAVLTIPIIGKWPWTWHDFVFGAVMLFGSASIFEFLSRNATPRRRLVIGGAVFLVLATIWVLLATGD